MSNSKNNPRFEVLINGKSAHIIGIEEFGVLAVAVDWVRRHPNARPTDRTLKDWEVNKIRLHVGGLDSSRYRNVSWRDGDFAVGDEITVRVLPPGDFDEPNPHESAPESDKLIEVPDFDAESGLNELND